MHPSTYSKSESKEKKKSRVGLKIRVERIQLPSNSLARVKKKETMGKREIKLSKLSVRDDSAAKAVLIQPSGAYVFHRQTFRNYPVTRCLIFYRGERGILERSSSVIGHRVRLNMMEIKANTRQLGPGKKGEK